MQASSELIFALSGVVVGIIFGVFGYRLLSRNHRESNLMQQKLLESERQVEELKARMGTHLLDAHQHIDTLRTTAHQLEQQLAQEARYWQLDDEKLQRLNLSNATQKGSSEPSILKAADSTLEAGVPRDYADGKSGTLSEDFGLKERKQAPQPPRY